LKDVERDAEKDGERTVAVCVQDEVDLMRGREKEGKSANISISSTQLPTYPSIPESIRVPSSNALDFSCASLQFLLQLLLLLLLLLLLFLLLTQW